MHLDREAIKAGFDAAQAPAVLVDDNARAVRAEVARTESLWHAPLMHGESSMQLQPAHIAALMDSK